MHDSDLFSELHCRIVFTAAEQSPVMSASNVSTASPAAASRSAAPSVPTPMVVVGEKNAAPEEIQARIDFLKKEVASERTVHIKKRMEENAQRVMDVTNNFYKLSAERKNLKIIGHVQTVNLLAKRQKDAIDLQNGVGAGNGEEDSSSSQEDGYASSAILLGSSIAVKNAVRPIKLPEVKKLPRYATWTFLDRNQRMTEDQSVVGRRRIYYDPEGGEALICSDSEEETVDEEEEKKEFAESEDHILRITSQEFGMSDVLLDLLANCFSRRACEVKARYEDLMKQLCTNNLNDGNFETAHSYRDKDLPAAMDSFDNLFCRRCHVFDCRLHGCSQELVFPAEKLSPWSSPDAEKDPCGPHCFRLVFKPEGNSFVRSPGWGDCEGNIMLACDGFSQMPRKKNVGPPLRIRSRSSQSDDGSPNAKNISESSDSEIRPLNDVAAVELPSPRKSKFHSKSGVSKRNSKRVAEHVLVAMRKRQKKMLTCNSDHAMFGSLSLKDLNLRSNSRKENEDDSSSSPKGKSPSRRRSRMKSPTLDDGRLLQIEAAGCLENDVLTIQPLASYDDTLTENFYRQEVSHDKSWKTMEKALYEQGLEMFGRNSCLIARNLLSGWKTCLDVFMYMNSPENEQSSQAGDSTNSLVEGYKVDGNDTKGKGVRRRSRFLRRRNKVRRFKYSWKSVGYHSIRKRISEKKDLPCIQYNPCTCQSPCGKDCPCLLNGTCCEKYCGCPKSCKNRFRGCHCAKSQCRSRQCPCFAADRECDPDVCRNCWISCGDGTLGVPSQRGDNYECRNMKLLLKQQQRVLLGRSDVSGWGAFLKNTVPKHEYLGEYTGELISHREADKRGKIYDRVNSSFLFNLNDQFVLDAYRKGDKLKFANHSPDPNCYAKVIMVAGDHRVGIFAKERICAGEELFYDYRYEPERAPAWARKPEASGTKKEYAGPSSGRAKKHT